MHAQLPTGGEDDGLSPGSRGAAALAPLAAAPEPPELDVRVTADVGPVVAWEGGALIGRFSTTGAALT